MFWGWSPFPFQIIGYFTPTSRVFSAARRDPRGRLPYVCWLVYPLLTKSEAGLLVTVLEHERRIEIDGPGLAFIGVNHVDKVGVLNRPDPSAFLVGFGDTVSFYLHIFEYAHHALGSVFLDEADLDHVISGVGDHAADPSAVFLGGHSHFSFSLAVHFCDVTKQAHARPQCKPICAIWLTFCIFFLFSVVDADLRAAYKGLAATEKHGRYTHMKEVLIERDVEIEGAGESVEGSIANSPKAYRALVSNGYKRKIESITREVLSNAYDANYDAGHNEPPVVHLPSLLDPYWRVRDFGVSMDDDMVKKNYSVLFWSNKDQDNTKVGKWGIGSKSPLSYSDSFCVTTYLDGIMRSYEVYYDNDSKMKITPMTSKEGEPTDEPNGVEISLPVRRADFDAFERALRRVALGLEVKPTVKGRRDFEFQEEVVIQSGTGWKLMSERFPLRGMQAKQGPVIYPLDHTTVSEIDPDMIDLVDSNIVIEFDIGELGVTLFREDLEYDDNTKASIMKRLKMVKSELVQGTVDAVAATSSEWEAIKIVRRARKVLPEKLHPLLNEICFRGQHIRHHVEPEFHGLTVEVDGVKRNRGHTAFTAVEISGFKLSRLTPPRPSAIPHDHNFTQVTPEDGTMIIVDDHTCDKETRVAWIGHRIKAGYDTGLFKKAVLVNIHVPLSTSEIASLFGDVPASDIMLASSLPTPDKSTYIQTRTYTQTRTTVKFRRLTGFEWRETDVDPEDGGFYVDLLHGSVDHPAMMSASCHEINQMVSISKKLGIIPADAEIIGIPGTHRKTPERNEGWVNVVDLCKKHADTVIFDEALYIDFQMHKEVKGDSSPFTTGKLSRAVQYFYNEDTKRFDAGSVHKDSPLHLYCEMVNMYNDMDFDGDFGDKIRLHEMFNCRDDSLAGKINKTESDMEHIAEEIMTFYPMIEYFHPGDGYRKSENVEKCLRQYVTMIDNQVFGANLVNLDDARNDLKAAYR